MAQSAVLVFARAPVPGACKTRLEPALGVDGCAALQCLLVEHALREASRSGADRVQLWCAPDAKHRFFQNLGAKYRVELVTQRGADLGERMHLALMQGLATARHALLIGTDCPAQDARRIDAALVALRRGADMVLRPARDGGYVGIGLTQPTPSVFRGVQWGSARVMRSTRCAARWLALRCTELAALDDLDTPADLANLSGIWRTQVDGLRRDFVVDA